MGRNNERAKPRASQSGRLEIPHPLTAEQEAFRTDLVSASKAGGRTGEAAKAVAEALKPYFLQQGEYALPPLGLLGALAQGKIRSDMRDVMEMTERLERELPRIATEHQKIAAALDQLAAAAEAEDKPHVTGLARRLTTHMGTLERVFYPAALLVGRCVRAQLGD